MTLFTRIRVMNILGSFLNQGKPCAITCFMSTRPSSQYYYEEDCRPIQKSLSKLYGARQKLIQDILVAMPTLNDALSQCSNFENINWKDVKQHVDDTGKGTYNNMLILDLCYRFKNYDAAISFVKYLRNNGEEINLGLLGRYLHCYYDRKKPLTAAEEEEILTIVNDIKQKHELLDEITLKHIIHALSLTSKWEDTISTFNLLNDRSQSAHLCEAIAIAAFNNCQVRIGFDMVTSIITRPNTKDCTDMYVSYLNYCKKYRQDNIVSAIEEIFKIWESIDYIPYYTEADVYIRALTELGWKVSNTNIQGQKCIHCFESMDSLKMSSEEFQELRKAVMDKLLVGSDIYISSTPRELSNFKRFLEKKSSYDMVVDGLNVIYKEGKRTEQAHKLIDHFLSKNLTLLIISRRHARRFYTQYLNNPKVLFYEVDNITNDDVYILYAALMGGPDTTFLSGDLMRQHKYKLQTLSLQRRFHQWQLSHHYRLEHKSSLRSSTKRMYEPLTYRLGPGKRNGIWHIPTTDEVHRTDPLYAKWLCLVPPTKQHNTMNKLSKSKVMKKYGLYNIL